MSEQQKLLALNRGEIAIRIMRGATELGLRTVGIYSKEDRLGLHRFKADEAWQIGEGLGPVQAYLDVKGIVALAKEKGVDFIHPGYGFLSENPALPRECEKAGITFVGPSAELLEMLGDKTAARKIAERAGVPIVPGTDEAVDDPAEAAAWAEKIGFPLIIKAAFGGGGRGMRVVESADQFAGKLEEARREAAAAFGNGAVFLERYIRRARHVEVQILGDRHGNIIHLYERDCSVQRRHQKVVETAPAVNLPEALRKSLADSAIRLAKEAGYYNAGTVEFLVDVERGEFYFIEVNPRIQVEHTVTEMITGVDLIRCQIQVARGEKLPSQDSIRVNGFALQCRVTTEDPANNFTPDYGRIQTYRSPAGFGVRLDGGSAYSGASITPFYDSLLVKISAWDNEFGQACNRMDRALREFRVRGVKTNIPFLENVVNNPRFRAGEVTTSFIDQTPELFNFSPRKDRATKILTFLGETAVNGNPEVAGKKKPAVFKPAPVPPRIPGAPPTGTRDLLNQIGPIAFSKWMGTQRKLLVTDTTFRDAHQSLFATRMRTADLLGISNFVSHKLSDLFSLEMWGGATFDVSMRFLLEDPWVRLRKLREAIPNICFQMLFRASNAVGYTAYPDSVVREFVLESARQGIDIFRIFDSLNYLPNMRVAMEAVRETDRLCEAAICYTGDILDSSRAKYSLKYYVEKAKELEKMGAHILGLKDMAGLLRPYAAEKLVKALREEVGIPIHFHTHDTSGVNAASILKASDAGVHAVDAAIASMSGQTSQPNLNSIVAALANTDRDTKLDLDALNQCADYWEVVRTWYEAFDSGLRTGSAEVYLHEMPGGQFTNLKEQAESMGLGDRWPVIARMYRDVNMAFGDIVKVTPSSKVVGDLALSLVSHGMTIEEFESLPPDHNVSIPHSVVDMFQGSLGEPDGGWPERIKEIVLQGKTTRKPVELPKAPEGLTPDETLSFYMYPDVFRKFAAARQVYGDVDVLPTPQFFYGMNAGEEIAVEIEPGKTLVVKFLTISDPRPDGTRTVFFELNGLPREIDVRDKSLKAETASREKADPGSEGQIGAPLPGMVATVSVQEGAPVKKGDKLMVIEAMKMQTTIYASKDGKLTRLLVQPGNQVDAKDLLAVIN
jgi:pyruvate carboxylase